MAPKVTFKTKVKRKVKGAGKTVKRAARTTQRKFNQTTRQAERKFKGAKKNLSQGFKRSSIGSALAGKSSSGGDSGLGIRSKIRTKTIDRGYKAIIEQMKVLEKEPYVKVGFPKESDKTNELHKDEKGKTHADLTVLDVAVFHEFGTETLPERSFMRASHDQMKSDINAAIKKLYIAVMDGRMTVSRALSIIGLLVERETKKFLTSNSVKPPSKKGDFSLVKFTPVMNASSKAPTKDVKRRSTKTLIDTAQMLNSITFVKIMNGKGKKP